MDFQATIRWVRGVFVDPDVTAVAYRDANPPVKQTFLELALPVVIGALVLALVLSLIFGAPLLGLLGVILWLGWMFVIAFIFDYLAGTFGGQRHFAAAYGMVALSAVPALAGSSLSPVAWIGWLISLAGSIYGLVLLYQFVPVFLGVPQDSRVKHFVIALIATLVAGFIVFAVLPIGGMATGGGYADVDFEEDMPADLGVLGDLGRGAELMEQAANDTYDPPADGKLTEAQVERYATVLAKAAALRDRIGQKWEGKDEESTSLSDVFSGVGDFARLGAAEMEVVKTGGGNWAEHQWVGRQLETARVHQGKLNEAVAHNFALFEANADRIVPYE